MPTTPNYALRYPAQTAPPNVPVDMQNLATDIEVALGLPGKGSVQYKRTTSFTVLPTTVTKLSFDTAVDIDTSSVTVASGQDFTLVRGGKWALGCNIPWLTTEGTAPYSLVPSSYWAWIGLTSDSTPPGRRVVASGGPTGSFQTVLAPNKTMRFNAGTVLSVWLYHDRTINRDVAFGQAPIDVTFTYLGL